VTLQKYFHDRQRPKIYVITMSFYRVIIIM